MTYQLLLILKVYLKESFFQHDRTISKHTNTEAMQCEDEWNCTETEIYVVCFQQDDTLEDDNVQWISCKLCSVWVHLNCININDNNDYICSFCQ